jgi:hypothetical protein
MHCTTHTLLSMMLARHLNLFIIHSRFFLSSPPIIPVWSCVFLHFCPRSLCLRVILMDRLCGLVARVPYYRSRGPGFDSRCYHISWEVVGLERGPLSLVRLIEELLERKVAAPVEKTEINGRGDSLRWPRDTLCRLKLALSLPTSGGRSVGIVRWRTNAPEFCCLFVDINAVKKYVKVNLSL